MSAEQLAEWREQIANAREVRKRVSSWWDANLKAYAPSQDGNPDTYAGDINTNRDFTLVERKKADLFYQKPDLTLIPSPLMVGQEALLETHAELLNAKLSLDDVDLETLVDQVLFDILCTAGTGWTVMGYEAATVPVKTEVPDGETPQPGSMLGLAPGSPKMKTVTAEVPIYEECFWEHVSPMSGLVPADEHTTIADKWKWIGIEFELSVRVAKRKGWVKKDYNGTAADPDIHFKHGQAASSATDVARGVFIVYKSSLYRDDRPHPLHQTHLILMDDAEDPAEHKDSPYQTLDHQGTLTPDSLVGFPIHPIAIRTMTDATHLPSDCTISRPLVNELNTFREQMVEQRAANELRWMYNTDVPIDAINKVIKSKLGGMVGMPPELFEGDRNFKEFPHGTYPRENFQFNDYLDNDLARTHALDANQSGSQESGSQSATEAQIKQSNVNARLGKERNNFLNGILRGATKYSAIMQRLLPVADAAKIVGPQAAQAWDAWRHTVPAALAFTALPDSALRSDMGSERKRVRDDYTYLANDPFINRQELLKQSLPKMGYSMKVLNPQPPQKGPEPAKIAFSFSGDDLNPLNPQFAIVTEILKTEGLVISPAAIEQAQTAAMHVVATGGAGGAGADAGQGGPPPDTAHGGKVAQMESLSKHANDLSGGMQGTGAPAPLGAGGTVQ